MTIKTRLYLLGFVNIAVVAFLVVGSMYNEKKLESILKSYRTQSTQLTDVLNAGMVFIRVAGDYNNSIVVTMMGEDTSAKLKGVMSGFTDFVARIETVSKETRLFDESFNKKVSSLRKTMKEGAAILGNGDSYGASELYAAKMSQPIKDISKELVVAVEKAQSTLDNNYRESSAQYEQFRAALQTISGVIVLFSLVFLFLTVRAITVPLREAGVVAKRIGEGEYGVSVPIYRNDELGKLGGIINAMGGSIKEHQAAQKEQMVVLQSKNDEIATRNRDMRMVMENVQEGFITVFKNGVMSSERSAVVDQWFGDIEKEMTFFSFLNRVDSHFAEWFDVAWDDLLADIMPMEVVVDQMPVTMVVNDRHLVFTYFPMLDKDDQFMALLVVISDVTMQLEHELNEAMQREMMNVFERVSKDRAGYLSYQEESQRLVDSITSEENDFAKIKREIHTLKGNSALYGISSVASVCHQVEDQMDETQSFPSKESKQEIYNTWEKLLENTKIFTVQSDDKFEVLTDDYLKLVAAIEARLPAPDLLAALKAWQLEPVQRQFDRISEQAIKLAERLGKGQITVEQNSHNLRLDNEQWSEFWSSLSHVVRNAVDHGLSDESEKKSKGIAKPGVLTLTSQKIGQALEIIVSDNGEGIDWEKVSIRADQLGIPHSTNKDLLDALFMDGFSTASDVSETSGRGVGLAAVRQAVEKMHGTIEVDSEPGKGTAWRFIFPEESKLTVIEA